MRNRGGTAEPAVPVILSQLSPRFANGKAESLLMVIHSPAMETWKT